MNAAAPCRLTAEHVEAVAAEVFATVVQRTDDQPFRSGFIRGITQTVEIREDALAAHHADICRMLDQLPDNFFQGVGGGWSFLNLCTDRHGSLWTGEQRVAELLMLLLMATDQMTWLTPPDMWESLPGGMPYLVARRAERGTRWTQPLTGFAIEEPRRPAAGNSREQSAMGDDPKFKFKLGQQVRIAVSNEQGTVDGVSAYRNGVKHVSVHYQAANGCATTAWFEEDQLDAA